jgi:hypothetical protein
VPILVIETLVASEVVHDIVDDPGNIIVDGDAEIVAEGALYATVTVADLVTLPPGPVAVNVYVVVADGDTVLDPDVGKLVPILVIETLVALKVDHDIVDDPGNIIVDGDAEIVAEGG